ncbi:uncharacterized protein [Rutidosis leptorrhynchoides]|uniref:uncharacterized protein n=1 Tax=Rutidosis leptorrhynchoides TaxID=125765 RepID=UPI003A98E16F
MKIISLNVCGFAAEGKFYWVRGLCLKERPNIAVFQETKCCSVNDMWVRCVWGDKDFRNKLIEIPISGKKFTRISDDGTKSSKLNRFLVMNSFISLWEDLSIVALDQRLSDHCPILLRDKIIDYGPKPFKVFNAWFIEEKVDNIIRDVWNQVITGLRKYCIFRDKLKYVKLTLKSWSKNSFGGLDNEINDLKRQASGWELKAECNPLNDIDMACWLDYRWKWVEKERVKTSMLKQKARIQWMFKGDENSKFFIQLSVEVKDVVFNHHQLIFRNCNSNRPRLVSAVSLQPNSSSILSTSEFDSLEQPFSESEIWFNFKKAFDCLSWDFLMEMMEMFGFGIKWRKLILSCLKLTSISVLVNESPTKEFKLGRGVRQGDPLSPFLFIIAAKGLNLLTKVAV